MKMFFKIFIIFVFLALLIQFFSVKVYPWFRHYGGFNEEEASSIQQTSDGGYIVAGFTDSYTHGNDDFAIYRLDSSGSKVWFKHYGGPNDDRAYSIQQTSDGGFVVAGYTYSYTYGGQDFAIYRLDSSGNKVWFKHYGGSLDEKGYSIQQTSDGGYIVAGYTESYTNGGRDFATYKLNSSGNKVWFKHYGGVNNDSANSIQQISDGGYIVAGYTGSYSYGNFDFGIYKLDSSGDKIWFKHYGGAGVDSGFSIQQISGGDYIVAGETASYSHGGYDFGIYKLNSSGSKIWFKHYGGSLNDHGVSIQQISGGGYIVAGETWSYTHGSGDFALYKLNSSGNKIWFKHYGGTGYDGANSVQQTSDSGFIVAGENWSFSYGKDDFGIYKLDSDGNK